MDLIITILWWILGFGLAATLFFIVGLLWLNACLMKDDEHD